MFLFIQIEVIWKKNKYVEIDISSLFMNEMLIVYTHQTLSIIEHIEQCKWIFFHNFIDKCIKIYLLTWHAIFFELIKIKYILYAMSVLLMNCIWFNVLYVYDNIEKSSDFSIHLKISLLHSIKAFALGFWLAIIHL